MPCQPHLYSDELKNVGQELITDSLVVDGGV